MVQSARRALAIATLLISPVTAGCVSNPPAPFDYYLLSMSWSPNFCAEVGEQRRDPSCAPGARRGFVLHGLWPQRDEGLLPACPHGGPVPDPVAATVRAMMPSRRLIDHEWRRHGACSGMDPARYFATLRRAWARVIVPPTLRAPVRPSALPPAAIETLFAASNPGLSGDQIALKCHGAFLAEVRVCMTSALEFRRCGPYVRDECPTHRVTVQPVLAFDGSPPE